MRFYKEYTSTPVKKSTSPKQGDIKIVSKFLLFPRKVESFESGDTETRWLERAYLVYRYFEGDETISPYWSFWGFADGLLKHFSDKETVNGILNRLRR